VDGQETVEIYSLGRAALGGSEIAAWTGRDRACSVDGQETVGSSLGNAALGRSERGVELRWEGATEKCRAVGTGFSRQIPSMRKIFQMVFKRWVIGHA